MSALTLLASAPTLAAIQDAIARFYCGEPKRLEPNGADCWRILQQHSGRVIEGVRVIRKGGRFRFESVAS